MALTLTEKLVVGGMGSKLMTVYLVTGDGESKTVQANQIKMQRIEFAYSVNITNEIQQPVVDYTAGPTDTVEFEEPISNTRTQLLICYGW
jgi:hypothetical protein